MSTRFFFFTTEELCKTSAVEKRRETISICDSKSGEEENKKWLLRCFVRKDRGGAAVEEGGSLLDSAPVWAICHIQIEDQ